MLRPVSNAKNNIDVHFSLERSVQKTERNLLAGLLIALILSAATAPAASALADTREVPTLVKWKKTARDTANGKKILALLKDANVRLKQNSTDKQSLYRRGYIYGIIGCTNSAILDLTKAIKIDPYYSKAYTERGICLEDSHLYSQALRDLDRAIRLDPRSGDARFARGRLLLKLNMPQKAAQDLRACTQSHYSYSALLPGELASNYYKAAHYYLGKAYEKLGRRIDALNEYKKFSIAYKKADTTDAGRGYLHRYADKPLDTTALVKKLGYKI